MKKRHNHTIYCSEGFKSRVVAVCDATDMSPADLVKAVFLFSDIKDFNDIILGETNNVREHVLVKSGINAGKTISRKPRIQIILPFKISPDVLKKALTLATQPKLKLANVEDTKKMQLFSKKTMISDNNPIIKGIQPDMIDKITTIRDALHILGFAPRTKATKLEIKVRYRALLKAYHSDTGNIFADTKRLSAVQSAWKIIDKSM